MDWKVVGTLLATTAPMAGKILGGLIPFPGGSLIGEQFGKIIARQFGVAETPAAVAGAISANPNEVVLAKINQAIEIARVEVAGFVDIEKAYLHTVEVSLTQVGATMRAEIGHEHWFFNGWRPAAGWVFVLYAAVFGAILMVAAVASAFFDKTQALDRLTAAWPIFAAYFATLAAMVGVYIIGRSQEKGRAIENNAPMPNSAPPPLPKAVLPMKPAMPPTIKTPAGDRS